MDNYKKLNSWILANSSKLNLKVERANWTKDWLPGVFDYRSLITLDGVSYRGRGIDKNKDLAFIKSFSEAIERSFCASNGIRSSGVAAHISLKEAQKKAKQELVERDLLFCHFLTKTPITKDDFFFYFLHFLHFLEDFKYVFLFLEVGR